MGNVLGHGEAVKAGGAATVGGRMEFAVNQFVGCRVTDCTVPGVDGWIDGKSDLVWSIWS